MKIGVIGCGYWGPNLIRNFAALDDVEVVAVADVRKERLDFIARLYPSIQTLTTEANDILRSPEIDAVVISTPVSSHFPLGKEALANG
ncbi:MAG: Gfo/Idh/MocA family oxidoreductase, partial [candidate division Zixibacteria bacterium]|nr:Gfo/Idh/MocA family oxidoreductase [candidate division Zixibacteria bacterium]